MPLFLNPVYLGALGLAAIPILIHLIRKRKVRIVQWAAWDFLLQSKRRNRRRLRLEQILLLLLRMLIVALVVLAFCRPLIRSLGLPMIAADAKVHALIVLDNSYSMGFRRDGVTEFERARQVADSLLSRVLKSGDSASVVLLSSRPEALMKEPTFDLSKARERVRGAKVSDRDTDYGAGAAFCADLLRNVKTPTREVYWITDNQKTGFRHTGQARAQAAWKELATLARITWIGVAEGARDNVAMESPGFSRELITPQSPLRVESLVRNYSSTPKNNLLVNLVVDGRPSGSAKVNVPAKGVAKASFVYLFEKPGVHTGTMQLGQPDSLERDNIAYFAAKVRERLKVLILDPLPGRDPAKDEAFYLATALSPVGASEGGSTAIQATVRPGSSLTGLDLRTFDAVVIAGVTDVAPTDRRALEDYVSNGGGLLLFPGPTSDPNRINTALGGGERFLPAKVGARKQLPEEQALSLNPASITHPALTVFRDTDEINLGSARFSMVYDLEPPANDPATNILCRFSGGQPAFVERRLGQGKVILSASTAGTGGGDMPYKPAFVPLVHQLVAYLAAGPTAHHNLQLGETIHARFDVKESGKPVRMTEPSGRTTLQKTTLGSDGVVLTYNGTGEVGLYRLGLAGRDNADAFAVNLPSSESDLTTATPQQVLAAAGPVQMQFARATDDLQSVVRQSRRGTEIWRPLVVAAMLLLFAEGLLSWLWGRRG
jgi:hypothetical protein